MNKRRLVFLSYLYLISPIIIFYLGYLKLYISIPLCICLVFLLYKIKKDSVNVRNVISKNKLLILFMVSLAICVTAGLGNLFYQSNDWHWRNAIFRDMINKPWPVYYPHMNSTLSYYIGFWIIPATLAKPFLVLGSNIAWIIGNIMLLLYAATGVFLVFLWIIETFRLKNKKEILFSILIFMLFSGMDIIGVYLNEKYYLLSNMHIEWWGVLYQFSSIITQLFWVFNQAIVAWLITWMYLNEKSIKNYFLLIILALPYCPLPFLGLIILFFFSGIYYFIKAIKKKQFKDFVKDFFSTQNVLALLCILPIYCFFYKTNNATSSNGLRIINELFNTRCIYELAKFWFLEIGIYFLLMYKVNRKNYLFYVSFLLLGIMPIIQIGTSYDFSMRASIPLIVVCIYFIIDYFNNHSKNNVVIILVFMIGLVTPFFEYKRAFVSIKENNKINMVADDIKSMDKIVIYCEPNEYVKKSNICDINSVHEDKCIKDSNLKSGNKSICNNTKLSIIDDKIIICYTENEVVFNNRYGNYANFISLNPENTFFYKHLARNIKGVKNDK